MATVESVNKEVSALSQRVSAAETSLAIWQKFIFGVAGAALMVGLAALGWAVHIGNKVTAIEQHLSDSNVKLVAELASPQSHAQLQANLSTVVAQVQTARAQGKAPDLKKIQSLSQAVDQVIQRDPAVPEGWRAASALVSFRPAMKSVLPPELASLEGPPRPNLGNCYQRPMTYSSPEPMATEQSRVFIDALALHDCTLNLDDLEGFQKSVLKHIREIAPQVPVVAVFLTLVRVKIIYHGGPIVPVASLTMYDCTFDFDVQAQPTPRGQLLVQALLSSDPTKGDVTLKLPMG